MLTAIDDQPITAEQQKTEREKLRKEFRRRSSESADARRRRIESFKRTNEENGALLTDFPNAFSFGLEGEETVNGHPACRLSAVPKPRTGPMSRAAKVLGGMHGTVWLESKDFHAIRADMQVVTPVPLYGIMAKVMPGTRILAELAPVSDSLWMISELNMSLTVTKLVAFRSWKVTRTTFSDYRLNAAVLDELLSER